MTLFRVILKYFQKTQFVDLKIYYMFILQIVIFFKEKMAYKYQPIKDEIFVSDTEDGDEEEGEELGEAVQEEFEEVNGFYDLWGGGNLRGL